MSDEAEEATEDKAYIDASPRAIGRVWAEMYKGMVYNDMPPDKAFEIMKVYVWGIAQQRPPGKTDDS